MVKGKGGEEEEITIAGVYAPNMKASKYIKQN